MSEGYQSLWGDLRGASFEQGYLDAGGVRQRCCAEPAGDAANALDVRHHVVASLRRQRSLHREGARG